MGAAGPNSLIEVVNDRIALYSKTGSQIESADLDITSGGNSGFFASVGTTLRSYDPWIIYDRYSARFIVLAPEQGSNAANFKIAISRTSDPADLDTTSGDDNPDWYFYSISATQTFGSLSWPDYPKFAVDANSIYITANYFHFSGGGFGGVEVTKLDKGPMLGGTLGTRTDVVASGASTLQPVQSIDRAAADPQLFVDETSSGVRVWEMNSSGTLTLKTTLTSSHSSVGGAPQSGTTTTLDTVSPRLINAVWRDNSIWTADTVSVSSKGAARWYEITTSGGSYSLNQTGTIDAGTGVWTFLPSVAVDAADSMGITYTQSSSSQFPAMMTTGRLSGDTLDTTQSATVQKSSSTYYSSGRWGDYSAVSVDPSDDHTFWAFNEYAVGHSTWGTWISSFTLATPPTLSSIDDQTATSDQQTLTASLSATDPNGKSITYTVTAQSLAYVLTQQQTGPLTYSSTYDNSGGRNEKWLQASSGQWYFILPTGELDTWDGGSGANGTSLGNVGTSYYSDPTQLNNPAANQPHATLNISGNTLTITRDTTWVSGMVITVRASNGQETDTKSFTVTVTASQGPVLSPISDTTITSSQQTVTVTLSATGSGTLTYSVTAQSLAYVLSQDYGGFSYYSAGDNWGGQGEKWFTDGSGQWYFLLADGGFYAWDGGSGATGTLLGTIGTSYYTDPTLLENPPADQPYATLSISGNTLTITRNSDYVSSLVITVTVSDGTLSDSKTFNVFVNP
jgi:hypothetical protein